MIFPTQSCER